MTAGLRPQCSLVYICTVYCACHVQPPKTGRGIRTIHPLLSMLFTSCFARQFPHCERALSPTRPYSFFHCSWNIQHQ